MNTTSLFPELLPLQKSFKFKESVGLYKEYTFSSPATILRGDHWEDNLTQLLGLHEFVGDPEKIIFPVLDPVLERMGINELEFGMDISNNYFSLGIEGEPWVIYKNGEADPTGLCPNLEFYSYFSEEILPISLVFLEDRVITKKFISRFIKHLSFGRKIIAPFKQIDQGEEVDMYLPHRDYSLRKDCYCIGSIETKYCQDFNIRGDLVHLLNKIYSEEEIDFSLVLENDKWLKILTNKTPKTWIDAQTIMTFLPTLIHNINQGIISFCIGKENNMWCGFSNPDTLKLVLKYVFNKIKEKNVGYPLLIMDLTEIEDLIKIEKLMSGFPKEMYEILED